MDVLKVQAPPWGLQSGHAEGPGTPVLHNARLGSPGRKQIHTHLKSWHGSVKH